MDYLWIIYGLSIVQHVLNSAPRKPRLARRQEAQYRSHQGSEMHQEKLRKQRPKDAFEGAGLVAANQVFTSFI